MYCYLLYLFIVKYLQMGLKSTKVEELNWCKDYNFQNTEQMEPNSAVTKTSFTLTSTAMVNQKSLIDLICQYKKVRE